MSEIENGMVRSRPICKGCGEENDQCCCAICVECGHEGHNRDFCFYDDRYYCDDCWEDFEEDTLDLEVDC